MTINRAASYLWGSLAPKISAISSMIAICCFPQFLHAVGLLKRHEKNQPRSPEDSEQNASSLVSGLREVFAMDFTNY